MDLDILINNKYATTIPSLDNSISHILIYTHQLNLNLKYSKKLI